MLPPICHPPNVSPGGASLAEPSTRLGAAEQSTTTAERAGSRCQGGREGRGSPVAAYGRDVARVVSGPSCGAAEPVRVAPQSAGDGQDAAGMEEERAAAGALRKSPCRRGTPKLSVCYSLRVFLATDCAREYTQARSARRKASSPTDPVSPLPALLGVVSLREQPDPQPA